MTRHCMIDIETLGTDPRAIVLSAAVGEFFVNDDNGNIQVGEIISTVFPIDPQVQAGRTLSESTLRWWLDQDPAIFKRSICKELNNLSPSIKSKIELVSGFIQKAHLWGNSSTFDNVIMRSLAKDFNVSILAPYQKERCYRTIVATFDPDKHLAVKKENAHDPVADVAYQIGYLERLNAEYGFIAS